MQNQTPGSSRDRRACARALLLGAGTWLAGAQLLAAPPALAEETVTLHVDVGARRHPISPLVYGVAYATPAQLGELNIPLHRNGGNATSRYNWQANASNRAKDYYFESLPYSGTEPGAEVDDFISHSRQAGAEPIITVPTVGWVARLGPGRSRLASFSVARYGEQSGTDPWFSDAGTGQLLDGRFVPNDAHDANVPSDPVFQKAWVQHLRERWGAAAQGGVRLYTLDNEPSSWHDNHRDIHPIGATMDEVRDKTLAYAAAIKSVDPQALVLGPEEWGWSGYFYSGYDHQSAPRSGYTYFPDRAAHGGWDYLPWLLDQLRQNEQATGQRLLDVFTVHYYPQGGEFSSDTSQAMQLRRNRSTRSLWDPSYVDESWINDKVMLVPRLEGWVSQYYPGTKVGITEYNWGAEEHINGATAQADILGIFGREGLDYAARWETPAATTPTFKAMKLYRNYDGQKSTFGDVSVACTVPDPDTLSAFAAERSSDGALTLMVINKALSGVTPLVVQLSGNTRQGAVQRWQLTSDNVLSRLEDIGASTDSLSTRVPAQSVTLFVLTGSQSGGSDNQPPVARVLANPVSGTAPLSVDFDGTGSVDPDGTLVAYTWDFGDGQKGSGPLVNHLYAQPGLYTATLRVTDNTGATATASVTIPVSSAPPPPPPPSSTLAAPSGFYAYGSGSQAVLNWTDNASDEEGFLLERCLEAWPMNWTEVARVGANVTSLLDTPPAPGTYLYRVRAYQGSAVSEASNLDSARVR